MRIFCIKNLVLSICLILALTSLHTNVALANQDQEQTEQELAQNKLNEDLLIAARQGDSAKISKLLDQGANINYQDDYSWTAISIASVLNHKDAVATLIKAKANVNIWSAGSEALPPLKLAIYVGNKEIVQMLVNAGADVNATNDSENDEQFSITPISFLSMPIFNSNNQYNKDTYTDILQTLLKAGANPNPAKGKDAEDNYYITPLMAATSLGNVDAAKLLIEYGAKVNYKTPEGITACSIAEIRNQQEMINLLKSAGAKCEVNKFKNTKSKKSNIDKIKLLTMQYVGDVCFIPNFGPLRYNDKPLDVISKCEGKKITDINVQDEYGNSLLMNQLYKEEYSDEYIKYLVKSGINLELKNNDGDTALLMAASSNRYSLPTIKTLLTAGANVNARNSNGQTVLMVHVIGFQGHESLFMTYACLRNYNEIIKILVTAGADINAKDNDGKTALMYAFEMEKDSHIFFLTKALLDAGADPNIKDNDGVSLTDVLNQEKFVLESNN